MKKRKAENIPKSVPAKISRGQCTHTRIRARFIHIMIGKSIYQSVLYQVNSRAVTKAILTVAWSEGKLFDGIVFKIRFQVLSKYNSGLSMSTKSLII